MKHASLIAHGRSVLTPINPGNKARVMLKLDMLEVWTKNQAELAGVQRHVLCEQDHFELAHPGLRCSLAGAQRPLNDGSSIAVDLLHFSSFVKISGNWPIGEFKSDSYGWVSAHHVVQFQVKLLKAYYWFDITSFNQVLMSDWLQQCRQRKTSAGLY